MKALSWLLAGVASLAVLSSQSISAQSSREEVVPGKTVISHSGTEGVYRDISLEAKLYEVYEKWVEEHYTWTEWECDYVPGDGKGDWKGFYNASKEQKPRALAAAIKGIGESRARDIVYSGARYFEPKPRSWQQFKNEISRIERDLKMYGLYREVIITYGDENYRNLGYAPEAFSGGSGGYSDGDGSDGDWKGFFNVPKAQKPAALAAAVRGIGEATAERIVYSDRGYFTSKPRSWEAFKDEIRRIESGLGLNDLYENVVTRYGSDNKQNLGYSSSYTPPSNPPYICRLVTKSGTQWVKKTDRRYVRSYDRRVDVFVSGSKLLRGEVDRITLVYDGRSVRFDEANSYNSYSASEDQRDVFTLSATGRRQVHPDIQDFSFSLSKASGNLYLKVRDNRGEELSQLEAQYAVNVSFVLVKKAGRCAKDKVLIKTTQAISGGQGDIELSSLSSEAFEVGETYYIQEISFERLNTAYFGGSSAKTKSTDFNF